MELDPETRRELRDYAWNYFAFHADQRLRTFNFFLALVTVIVGGLIAILSNSDRPILGLPLAAALVVVAVIFWLLDERNHDLLTGSETALKSIEASMSDLKEPCSPGELQLFLREKHETDKRKKSARLFYFTYHSSFRLVFLIVAAVGLALVVGLIIAEYQ